VCVYYTVAYPCRRPFFSCKNVRCIAMDRVLDGRDDCFDQSDEGSSSLLLLFCVFVCFHTAYMLCYCQHSGVDLVELKPRTSLQCFDTVGWVFWPLKPVPDMTYDVFGGTLNLAQLQLQLLLLVFRATGLAISLKLRTCTTGCKTSCITICTTDCTAGWSITV